MEWQGVGNIFCENKIGKFKRLHPNIDLILFLAFLHVYAIV